MGCLEQLLKGPGPGSNQVPVSMKDEEYRNGHQDSRKYQGKEDFRLLLTPLKFQDDCEMDVDIRARACTKTEVKCKNVPVS